MALHILGSVVEQQIDENDLSVAVFSPQRTEVLRLLVGQIGISIHNAELYERLEDMVAERTRQLEVRNRFIRDTFGRYLTQEVVDSLLEDHSGLQLGGEPREVTILIADLRGFTAVTEALPPEAVVALLNNYLSVMTDGVSSALTVHDVGGIGAPYELALKRLVDDGAAPETAIRAEFVRIVDKVTTAVSGSAQVTKLSLRGASLVGDVSPPSLSDIKVTLRDEHGGSCDVYAKVLRQGHGERGFRVRFTSVAGTARDVITSWLAQDEGD